MNEDGQPDARPDARPDGRQESPAERADRNLGEMLQELRVLQTGVQILFGFLLILAVQPRFASADGFEKGVYFTTLLLSCVATIFLMAPVAYHRVLFGRGRKVEIVKMSNRLTHVGMVALWLAISSAVLLVLDLVLQRSFAWIISIAIAVLFLAVWYVLPLSRLSDPAEGDD
ncbi:DUF6328 family protein [Tenggerimyces flavus]|uniref:DUF6328 family protein n=1 Tax=Tenggerimyces flavus TaxID=1708749 RepID=A0ABV7YEZ2_9ACTN|nr:DUF6328 family protein [Tenggerimyces flavus]MBM7786819.1 hypothetical protein [Tenggerimyces flavus]